MLAYGPNSNAEYLVLWGSRVGLLGGTPTGVSVVLLGDLNTHVGSNSETWRCGNLSGVPLLDFCASYGLSIRNTMFKPNGVQQSTFHQYTWAIG